MTPTTLPSFKPKLCAFDMDGTLLDPEHRLSEETSKALHALADWGAEVVVATGRHYADVTPYLDLIPKSATFVTCNGGVIWNYDATKFEYNYEIPRAHVDYVIEETLKRECAIFVSCDDGRVYGEEGTSPYGRQFCDDTNIYQHVEPKAKDFLKDNPEARPYKISCIGRHEHLEKIQGFVDRDLLRTSTIHSHPELRNRVLKTAFGLPQLLDVQPAELSKAAALDKICQQRGIQASEVIAAGDGMNDEEMIRWAGCGFAMANANPKLIALADGELPPHTEDGVAQMIRQLLDQWA